MDNYKIAIIGAGPGGYVAAIRAAQLGARVALIEEKEVGGVCLNAGCIPTKSLIASANRLKSAQSAGELGIGIDGEIRVELETIITRKNNIVTRLVKGIHQLIKSNGVGYINGRASFNSDGTISVDKMRIRAENVIIATGSKWKAIPGLKPVSKLIVTSDEMLSRSDIPERLCIVGGGVIGCEFAGIYSAFGSDVTIVEAMSEILPAEDVVTSKLLTRALRKRGIRVFTGTTISSVEEGGMVRLSNGDAIQADKVMVAVGRIPSFEGLGIEKIGVEVRGSAIVTDDTMKTSVEGVYAIGDVNGKFMLAHVASEEGIVAVENIMGHEMHIDYGAIPRPVYTDPEICCVGATAKHLMAEERRFNTGSARFIAAPKALCDAATEGQAVLYSDGETNRVLGAQIIGEHATELAAEVTLAIRNGLTVNELSATIHSHPTLSELIKEASEDCLGRAIHKVYQRARIPEH